jgi:DtxR family transcriptional regulator, Mn-dependent transcriptional regulator
VHLISPMHRVSDVAGAPEQLDATARSERRHALVERMLADLVGVPWEKVHRQADRWADEVSDELEAHLASLLGDPGTCPHGNPIPGSANIPDQSSAVPLAAAPLGPVRVVRISEAVEEDDVTMARLAAAGFTPGAECEVADTGAGDVAVAGAIADMVIDASTAREVWVDVI